jgi:hypothetical protein
LGRKNRVAAKFITRLRYLFTGELEKEDRYDSTDWIPGRVAEIKARIAAVESTIGRTKESYKNTPAPSKPVVANPAPEPTERDKDLMALKAKLMAGKKN